jgi:hypothetical protein
MKNDLPYFTHDNNARLHPKFQALLSQYGAAGYGQFWMLNEIISQAEDAKLDLSKKINRGAVARQLGMTFEELDSFLAFISDPEIDLANYKDFILTTDRTQENYAVVKAERERKKEKYHSSSETPRKIDDSPGKNVDSPGSFDTKQSKAKESKGKEQQHAREGLVNNLAEETKKNGLVLQPSELEALTMRINSKNLDLGFVAFCADRVSKMRGVKNPRALLKRTLLEYDDAAEEYRIILSDKASAPPPLPEPPACPECGRIPDLDTPEPGKPRTATCAKCRRTWTYNDDWQEWHEDPEPLIDISKTG